MDIFVYLWEIKSEIIIGENKIFITVNLYSNLIKRTLQIFPSPNALWWNNDENPRLIYSISSPLSPVSSGS